MCVQGARVVQQHVLSKIDDQSMAVFAVWQPMLKTDAEGVARRSTALLPDARVAHFWDDRKSAGRLFRQPVGLTKGLAWDLYLVYGRDAIWTASGPSHPLAWMHQLRGRLPDERLLDGTRFAKEVSEALGDTRQKADALVTLDVEGMTCGGCAATLTEVLSKLEGVSSARVDFERKEAQVLYDPERCSPAAIVSAVEKAGYKGRIRR